MSSILDRLFQVVQQLKAAAPATPPASRWFVERRDGRTREPAGPYEAAELAYLARTGRLRPDDAVVHATSGARVAVAAHPFLARWLGGDPRLDRRLVRALSACAQAWTAAAAAAPPTGPATAATAAPHAAARPLTPEERRAFRLLQLDPGCTPGEARARLRALAARHHPDRGGSVERMQEITWAWSVVEKAVGA